jgi:peptide chain release factor 2
MMQEIKNTLNQLRSRIQDLGSLLNIEAKRKKVAELSNSSQSSDLWQNQKEAQRVLRELKVTEDEIKKWEGLRASCDDLLSIAGASEEEDALIEKEIRAEMDGLLKEIGLLEVKTLLGGEYDKSNAILTITAGAGGRDAQDWANILVRMYSRFCADKGYDVDIPEISWGEEGGIKSATLLVSGIYAYGYLKNEKGVHRLVRMSPFNADGKRHTSFAMVDVIPEITEEIDVKITPSDLRIDTFRASGPGGQHVNKTDSAIRITHIPTGIVSQSQSDRSQHVNREAAMKILKARIYERMLLEQKKKIEDLRGEFKEIGWGNQIRSYVFHPYTMVKDHRTGVETSSVDKVIDGDLDLFIEASLRNLKKQG